MNCWNIKLLLIYQGRNKIINGIREKLCGWKRNNNVGELFIVYWWKVRNSSRSLLLHAALQQSFGSKKIKKAFLNSKSNLFTVRALIFQRQLPLVPGKNWLVQAKKIEGNDASHHYCFCLELSMLKRWKLGKYLNIFCFTSNIR